MHQVGWTAPNPNPNAYTLTRTLIAWQMRTCVPPLSMYGSVLMELVSLKGFAASSTCVMC